MGILRWALDWLAPALLVCLGFAGLISSSGLLDGPRERASMRLDTPWWITVPLGVGLLLLGAFRLRQNLRRRSSSR